MSPLHPAGVPTIAATVKVLSPTARLVHIVNTDNVPGYFFLITSTDSPKIVSASGPCKVFKVGTVIGIKQHTHYRAHCKVALRPGKAVDIRLTTSGNGNIGVTVCPTKTFCLPR